MKSFLEDIEAVIEIPIYLISDFLDVFTEMERFYISQKLSSVLASLISPFMKIHLLNRHKTDVWIVN